ncbi:MAG: hypothetical protein EB111_00605 [Actinobacteria bacterium]|nr:hypothetical protein [Actinomycetota bacterium]
MAIIERPSPSPATIPALTPAAPAITPARTFGALRRPVASTGWKSWLFTVDHKKLGLMYGAMALFFFIVGGIEAVLIRMQLAAPNGKVLNADLYNQMFTMHATTMVFLFVMPMAAAFANYFIPLQIGARDVAFPRINAFGFWCVLGGGIVVNLAWFLGGAADGGWFMYAPNSGPVFSPSHGVDFWALGLQIAGIASLTGAINLIVTVLNMRAPGMTLMKMPVFTWMITVVQFLLLFAVPVITVALFLLSFQRMFGAQFFDVAAGADPLLWQHLFWIFGHPEVYILILPSFGIISEVLPVFSRKPLFGYPFVVFSGAAIGFVGWGVWAHHMFASGLGPVSVAFGPMHILGLQGQPRRMYVWTEARAGEGFFNLAFWNLVASIGSLILTVGVLFFLINIVVTARNKERAPLDPWNARSLEWMTSNPPKEHNFDSIPHVHHLDEFFHRKYEEDPVTHTMREVATAEQVLAELERNADQHIHMPSPSYWPIVLATGLPIIALGLIYSIPVAIVGGLIVLYAMYGWALEPSVAPESDFDTVSGNGASGNGHAVGASHG